MRVYRTKYIHAPQHTDTNTSKMRNLNKSSSVSMSVARVVMLYVVLQWGKLGK